MKILSILIGSWLLMTGINLGISVHPSYPASMQHLSTDSAFRGMLVNDEYKVYLEIDAYRTHLIIPSQEFLGEVPGYIGDEIDSRKWIVTDIKLLSEKKAKLQIINDYGSEDLNATLIYYPADSSFVLRQEEGADLKIARNNKWQKLPTELRLKRKR